MVIVPASRPMVCWADAAAGVGQAPSVRVSPACALVSVTVAETRLVLTGSVIEAMVAVGDVDRAGAAAFSMKVAVEPKSFGTVVSRSIVGVSLATVIVNVCDATVVLCPSEASGVMV